MTPQPLRTVFDTNVLLQAMARPTGPAGACVDLVREGRITLFISIGLIAELEDVLSRPSLRAQLRVTDAVTSRFLEETRLLASVIDPVPVAFEHVADPKDSMVVNLAVAAGAHVITSRDRHLLSLRDAKTPAGADFMSRFGFIEVLTPVDLLNRLCNK
jgi:putative PIN family toxin of toxin-antitoxin system